MSYSLFLLFTFNGLYFSVGGLASVSQGGIPEPCNTVQQKPGRCIQLEDCPYLFNLSQEKQQSLENKLYLTLSQCSDDESFVCCDAAATDLVFSEITPSPVETRGIVKATPCDTPEGAKGQCITLEYCPPLRELLKFRPFLPENGELLRRSGCGFEGTKAKVCCPVVVESASIRTDGVDTRSPTGDDDYIPEGPVTSDLLPGTNICGFSGSNRITGGEIADLAEFPWMALVEYDTPRGNRFNCGGSLISNRYVLTAAHCVRGKDLPASWKIVSVRLGEYDISTPQDCIKDPELNSTHCSDAPLDIPVEEQITHEQYTPYNLSQHHDIALLRLVKDVAFTEFVRPICLPTLDLLNNRYTGVNMTVAGWGGTGTSPVSNILLKLEILVKSFRDCSTVYGKRINFGSSQICAGGDRDKDTCKGDSGGPLMAQTALNYFAAGIVSFGPDPCGRELWPGVYTKTSHYLSWIVSKLKP